MNKLIAAVCVVSLSACSASGMTLGLGAGVTVAGGALLLSNEEDPGCEPLERATTGCYRSAAADMSNGITTVAGLALVTFGVVMMGLGAWGVGEEKPAQHEPGLALVPAQPTAAPSQPAVAFASSNPDEAAQQQKLSLHVQLAARANRCDAAVYLLARLRRLDEARAISLIQADEQVARCTLAKEASLGS